MTSAIQPILRHRRPVAIIGAGSAQPDSELYRTAYAVAARLAGQGIAVVCGGRTGVMAAACQGAHEAGGLSIAILPRLEPAEANPYATIVLTTDLGDVRTPLCSVPEISRNRVVAASAACLVAIGGGPGTADEIGHALRFNKTVFGLCDPPQPAALAGDPRPVSGRLIRLASADEALARICASIEGC